MTSLAQVPWQTLLAGGTVLVLISTLALVFRAILKGSLVPRTAVEDIRADRDKWEAAWRTQQDTLSELDNTLDANTEALRLMQQLVESLATKGPAT